jgi:outer membrane lipoprotein-sorting protein
MTIGALTDFKKLMCGASLALTLGLTAWGQTGTQPAAGPQEKAKTGASATATPATPTADQILDRYIEASGGREAWKKLTTRVSKGTIEIPAANMSGTIEVHEKAPDMMIVTVTVGGNSFQQGFDGKVAWSNDPQNGLRELSGDELAETKRDADFYRPLDMRSLYKKFAATGSEKIGDRETYVLEATAAEAAEPDKIYFDAQTGLPVRVITQRHTDEGVTPFQEDISDYREVDGIKMPFSVHQSNSQSEFTITFTEIQHNVQLDDAQFSKPAAQ